MMNRSETTCISSQLEMFECSYAQQRLWLLDQLSPHSARYNIPAVFQIKGPLNTAALSAALSFLVERHEPLRTTFHPRDGLPWQVVHPPPSQPVLQVHPAKHRDRDPEDCNRTLQDLIEQPFDLSRDLMLRAHLIERSETDHLLVLVLHHIAADGWSMQVLYQELAAAYKSFCEDSLPSLPDLPIQYVDFAAWQRQSIRQKEFQTDADYWSRKLQSPPPSLDLPFQKQIPTPSTEGDLRRLRLSDDLVSRLQAFCRREQLTPYMLLSGVLTLLLHRLADADEIPLATPVAARTQPETEGLIGFFVNTVLLRHQIQPGASLRQFLQALRHEVLETFSHETFPFDQLPDRGRPTPRFQLLFSMEQSPEHAFELLNLAVSPQPVHTRTAKFDLTLMAIDSGQSLELHWEYKRAMFDSAAIDRWHRCFEQLLQSVLSSSLEEPLAQLRLIPPQDEELVVRQWNNTVRHYPRNESVVSLFEQIAGHYPDQPALHGPDSTLTYKQLTAQSDALAAHLIDQGVSPGSLVPIALDRSPDFVVSILAVLKAGAAYLPVDLSYPAARIRSMFEDAQPAATLSRTENLSKLPDNAGKIVDIDHVSTKTSPANPAALRSLPPPTPDQTACVIFTSGSTGRPKGVRVPHRAIVRLTRSQPFLTFQPGDVTLQYAAVSFDASTFEIWGPLLNGGAVIIPPPGLVSLENLGQAIRSHQNLVLWLTAGLFHAMVDERIEDLQHAKAILTGGETLSPQHAARFKKQYPGVGLLNMYGPTENTTFSTWYEVPSDPLPSQPLPIGRPIANSTAYILDRFLQPLPPGAAGELFLGGDGLAQGYLQQPQATRERFITSRFQPEPASPDGRLYRTGDLARWSDQGLIEFLGRRDSQVKIRGFRIELEEIRIALMAHPQVADAAVVVHGEDAQHKCLVAYWTPAGHAPPPPEAALRDHVCRQVPPYMVPSFFVQLDRLPLTANGKLDRGALPTPAQPSALHPAAEPLTETEQALAQIWAELLRAPVHRPADDFFALGGQSLLATQMLSRIYRHWHISMPLNTIFESSTLREFSTRLEETLAKEGKKQPDDGSPAPPQPEPPSNLEHLSEAEIDALLKQA